MIHQTDTNYGFTKEGRLKPAAPIPWPSQWMAVWNDHSKKDPTPTKVQRGPSGSVAHYHRRKN